MIATIIEKNIEGNNIKRLLIFCFVLLSCITSSKWYIIKKILPSPNKENIAVVFLGDRHTLSSYLPKVSIFENDKKINFNSERAEVFVGYRTKYIDAYWKDDKTLIIKHNCFDDYIFKQLEEFREIKIEYILATTENINPEDEEDFNSGWKN